MPDPDPDGVRRTRWAAVRNTNRGRDETDYRMGLLVPESGLFKEESPNSRRANGRTREPILNQVNPVCQVKKSVKKSTRTKVRKKILDKRNPDTSTHNFAQKFPHGYSNKGKGRRQKLRPPRLGLRLGMSAKIGCHHGRSCDGRSGNKSGTQAKEILVWGRDYPCPRPDVCPRCERGGVVDYSVGPEPGGRS